MMVISTVSSRWELIPRFSFCYHQPVLCWGFLFSFQFSAWKNKIVPLVCQPFDISFHQVFSCTKQLMNKDCYSLSVINEISKVQLLFGKQCQPVFGIHREMSNNLTIIISILTLKHFKLQNTPYFIQQLNLSIQLQIDCSV